MFERGISEKNVKKVLQTGEMIEDYSDEMPFPGGLMLGRHGSRPLHVVASETANPDELVIITVYEPASTHWKSNFKSRKP